jgi:hypothetical protein
VRGPCATRGMVSCDRVVVIQCWPADAHSRVDVLLPTQP